jgi:hypothetical protein
MKRNALVLASMLLAVGSTACAGPGGPEPSRQAAAAAAPPAAPERPLQTATITGSDARSPANRPGPLPRVIVHKSPSCGCCGTWVEHMRSAGFEVEVRDSDDLAPIKTSLGVPADKASCHTAQVGGYFVEGHVPADDVKRLLAEHPDARGIAVPGLPPGSPGMEVPAGRERPFSVDLVARDGTSSTFARH